MTALRPLVLALLAIAVTATTAAAQPRSDRQVWVSADGQAALAKEVRLGVEQQLRLADSGAGFDETFTQLSLKLRAAGFVGVGVGYRYIVRSDDERRHRGFGDIYLEHDLGPVELEYRLRLQATTRQMDTQTVVRNRLRAGLDLPHRLTPYLAGEVFEVMAPNRELRELRAYAGLDWQTTKALGLELFYLRQQELNVNHPERNDIVGFGMSYRFYKRK